MNRPDPFRVVVAVGCAYELAALPQRSPLPTISQLCATGARHPLARWGVFLFGGALTAHLLGLV